MPRPSERPAGYELLQSAVGVALQITRAECLDVASHCAFGIPFVPANLSFHDARPHGTSVIAVTLKDELSIADFVSHLQSKPANLQAVSSEA